MATKEDLQEWLLEALREMGGSAPIIPICRWVWEHKEPELRASDDLFYTWQYDIRWAATKLRHAGRLKPASLSPSGVWELT
jgi:hypothetical protein